MASLLTQKKVEAIKTWPVPQTVHDVRSFMGLASFYRRFVEKFATKAAPLTNLMTPKYEKKGCTMPWGPEESTAFEQLKEAMCSTPVLVPPDPDGTFVLRTDASGIGLGAVLTQIQNGVERVVAYHSRKLNGAETRYAVHERELLAVMDATRVWRHYLLGTKFRLLTDNWANKHLQTQPHLDPKRQARWMEKLQEYEFELEHIPGERNVVADALSRRPDYALGAMAMVEADEEFLEQIRQDASQDSEYQGYCEALKCGRRQDFTIVGDLLYFTAGNTRQLYLPVGELRQRVLYEAHDARTSGHLGRDKTMERLRRQYYWPGVGADVHTYVRTCPSCQKNKPGNAKPIGLLRPLPIPTEKWEQVSLDLITQLPACKGSGYDTIVTFVDRLTKMIHLAPTHTTVTAEGVADIFMNTVFRHHGMPRVMVSDRDSKFTSDFWRALFKYTGTRLNMSTAYHPQTDGQTERANRTIEDMLRACVSPHHDDWDQHLVAIEFAYNNSIQASTGYTPFYLNYGRHPETPFDIQGSTVVPPKDKDAAAFVERIANDLSTAKHNIARAQERQAKAADKKRRDHTFRVGDKVMLSHKFAEHLANCKATSGVSRKLNSRNLGPFEILEVVGQNACRLKLPARWTIHPVLNASYLTPWKDGFHQFPDREPPPPDPELINGEEHYEVEAFRNHRWFRGYLQYYVKWVGHGEESNEWCFISDLAEDLDQATLTRLVREYRERRDLPEAFANAPSGQRRRGRR